MPQSCQVHVGRHPRFGVPVVSARFNQSRALVYPLVVATSEPATTILPNVAASLLFETGMERAPTPRRGRRGVPSDLGIVLAPLIRVQQLELELANGEWLPVGGLVGVVTNRPFAFGVAGLPGIDGLARFSAIQFRVGPPDVLTLEQE